MVFPGPEDIQGAVVKENGGAISGDMLEVDFSARDSPSGGKREEVSQV